MPLKTKTHRSHHATHKKEKRTKRFLKVYAPYIPLLVIVGCGLFVGSHPELSQERGAVESYAHDINDLDLLSETNKMRAREGLQPLRLNTILDNSAQAKALDMGKRNYWSHITPDGKKPWDFINSSEYNYQKAAENLAYGFDTSSATVAGWMNSPGHRANILDPELKEVGFGIINVPNYQNKGAETVIVAMYADPTGLAVSQSTPARLAYEPPKPQESTNVSFLQSFTQGKAPWSSFAAGLLIGVIATYFVATHIRSMRRTIHAGEKFVIHHPVFDVTLVALSVLAIILSRTVGTIL